ncbi:MAG: putative transporter ATPase and permease component [Frankiales bacterium]|nr:putative transporter ATPase and permease component [Frankiales bacterium]
MRATLASAHVEASLTADAGEVVALVGPNGAGKTSLLRALAGLLPSTGTVELAGRDVAALPVHARGVGWVPQSPSLFTHLSARDNAAYALRARGIRRSTARDRAQDWLTRLGIGELGDARPRALSGGQVARVALARALAAEPDLLLLDEPLAALDTATRDDVRRLLRTTLAGGRAPVLVVTHDPVDVVALADRLVVLERGRVVQEGSPAEVAAAPRSTWVAGLLGQNAWRGTCDATGLVVDGGHIAAADPLPAGTTALALCEPSAVTLHRSPPQGSARTVLRGPVGELRALGGRVRVVVESSPWVTAEVTVAAAAELRLTDGGEVWAALKATEVRLVSV